MFPLMVESMLWFPLLVGSLHLIGLLCWFFSGYSFGMLMVGFSWWFSGIYITIRSFWYSVECRVLIG